MRLLLAFLVLGMLFPMVKSTSAQEQSESTAELSKRDMRLAKDSLASTYRSGDWNRLLGLVRKSLARRSVDDILALDKYLEAAGGPSLSAIANTHFVFTNG